MQNLYQRIKPIQRILNMRDEGWTVWDCSPIYGADGRVHVFATRWRSLDRPDATWYMGSQIVHAVADKPEGPYKVLGVVIEGDGGAERWDSSGVINAKIYAVGDQYCLLYTGCTEKRHDTQAVGMLLSRSLDGPWERVAETPIIAPERDRRGFDGYLCNNPAMVVHPNGEFWVYYKGRPVVGEENGRFKGGGMTIGLATAKRLGGPYVKCPANPLIDMGRSVEDPYVWHDGKVFWMLVSEMGLRDPAGSLLSSSDGLAWSKPEEGYPSPTTFLGRNQRLEEPNLLFADGRPTHLFNVMGACPEDDVYSGFVSAIAEGA